MAPLRWGWEQAALGECLLAAMDAADREPGAEERLVSVLDNAKLNDDGPVVFTLDALARIAADAEHRHGPGPL